MQEVEVEADLVVFPWQVGATEAMARNGSGPQLFAYGS
jgi:hypothetical protein